MKMVLLRNKKSKEIPSITTVANSTKLTYTIFDEVEAIVDFTKHTFKIPGYLFDCKGYFTHNNIKYGVFKDNSIQEVE